jgi:hypothetical protein
VPGSVKASGIKAHQSGLTPRHHALESTPAHYRYSARSDRAAATITGSERQKIGLQIRRRTKDGGVRSQIRTGLHLQFPGNREINREFYDFAASGSDPGTKSRCAATVSSKFPAKINREIIFGNREISDPNREVCTIRTVETDCTSCPSELAYPRHFTTNLFQRELDLIAGLDGEAGDIPITILRSFRLRWPQCHRSLEKI